jgi:hypothetical protein
MKSIYLLLLLLLFSCSTPKIRDFDKDYTQELLGKIKSITIKTYEYKYVDKDTVMWAKTIIQNFDTNNTIINEKFISEFDEYENAFKYQNGLLVEKKAVGDKNNFTTTYKYDENNNQIEEKSFNNNVVFGQKERKFDKYKNPIEEKYTSFGKEVRKTETEYDYKKKSYISKTAIDTFKLIFSTSKKEFNKKGYITKYQPLNFYKTFDFQTYEIDKKGNLTKKTLYKNDNTIIETVTYKNTYDKKGNIIVRERFLNNKLLEKTTYDIVYL